MKLQSFFFDQTGRPPEAGKLRRPAAALKPDTRHLKPIFLCPPPHCLLLTAYFSLSSVFCLLFSVF
jgi:hypothetical protein